LQTDGDVRNEWENDDDDGGNSIFINTSATTTVRAHVYDLNARCVDRVRARERV